ncbi:hypothetical protein BCR32DRAFT_302481 [Anaeromyces robustus]|uniref:Asteroid domain-containing protein n=1 Tax=Anaeromyces robustus TaxID=1754192 RepID=A0A1Y1WVW3_9FUNG|nr:hypothetical protein BCR32DRAFT_302481 [Anaeromyces robustus]|eukprot:ORX77602.1 hypothetical protein BCR32DRAFT_302481 [Anaeromyces robustus]
MGVRGLNSFVKKSIYLPTQKWIINETKYNILKTINDSNKKSDISLKDNSGNITLIIDGNAYFYYLSDELNWFIFDNLKIFELLHKQLCLLLAIDGLKKIIFVLDGVDTDMKMNKKRIQANERIKSVHGFFNKVVSTSLSPNQNLKPDGKNCPTPLVLMSFIQFLCDSKKLFDKVDVKFSLREADSYIAKLAIENNGYVISNDSDFFIYDIPGYINFSSIKFPENNSNLEISYQLYRNNLIIDYLHLTKEALPFFATFCSNDYLTVGDYPQFFEQIKKYRCNNYYTNNIKPYYYKCVVNFIIDCCKGSNNNQETIKRKIMEYKRNEYNENLNTQFINCLNDSIHEYDLTNLNNLNTLEFNKINQDILESYFSGKIYAKLLNVLENDHYKLTQYFECFSKGYCWNITYNLRNEMYMLLIQRNKKNENETKDYFSKNKITITEYGREGIELKLEERNINIKNDTLPITIDDRFKKYLDVFKSDWTTMKKLPYFLIPLATTLRYYLIEKINMNLFIFKENDNNYSQILKFSNSVSNSNNNLINKSTIQLHDYEFEALLASSIAALTLTYLNKTNEKIDIDKIKNSSYSSTITQNIKECPIKCNNSHEIMIKNKKRSLHLKSYFNINSLQGNRQQFENAIQIFSEYVNMLIMNSNMLQILKLTDDFEEFFSFFSMYHYSWEEAFYIYDYL